MTIKEIPIHKCKKWNIGDDDIYHEFATKLLSNKLDKKQLEQVNELMRIDEENKKEYWKKIRQRRATELGMSVRKIFHKTKIKN